MDSCSGIIIEETRSSEQFTDFTPMPCKGFNILCKARRYGRWWMLKGLKAEYREQETYRAFLRKEFDILISLQHPNIVAATSLEYVGGLGTCIVMEWIDGVTLQEWLALKRPGGKDILVQLLDALLYIHAKQIVHRDLKPSNIMIAHNGCHVKLIDFGLADTDSYAVFKQPAGTPGYISPEQMTSRKADIRNDIYSVGCILECMHLGDAYNPIISRCKGEMERRYASVDEIRKDIVGRKSWQRKHVAIVVLAILVGVALSVGTAYTLLYYKGESPVYGTGYVGNGDKDRAGNVYDADSDAHRDMALTTGSSSLSSQADNLDVEALDAQIIQEGQRTIDLMWLGMGIDTMKSAVMKSDSLYQFVNRSNSYITDGYPATFSGSITGSHKAYIISELSAYASEKYIKPAVCVLQSEK